MALKNITITMDDAVADWVRVEAAKRNVSISRLIGDWIAEEMRRQDAYEQAKRAALKFETWGDSTSKAASKAATGGASPVRDDQYDRPAGIR